MELLILLVENRGDMVTRDEIVRKLWGDGVFLETENSVNTAINKLRSVLHDHPKDPAFIRTVIGKGYLFIADVDIVEHCSHGQSSPEVAASSPSPTSAAQAASQTIAGVSANLTAKENGGSSALQLAPDAATHRGNPAVDILTFPAQHSLKWGHISPQWAAAALALVALASVIGFAIRDREPGPGRDAIQTHTVAVLPFSDLSGDSEQDYPVDSITDEVTTLLARSNSVRVISRRSTMPYKGVQEPLSQIAADLHVDAVVEGSVVHSGKTVRITAQLLDPQNDQHLWAEVYRDSGEQPLETLDKVAADIAREVASKLTRQSIASEDESIDLRARDFLLRGRFLANTPTPASTE